MGLVAEALSDTVTSITYYLQPSTIMTPLCNPFLNTVCQYELLYQSRISSLVQNEEDCMYLQEYISIYEHIFMFLEFVWMS